jgi:alkaline phosphatase isozyme conversion protein
MFIINYVKAGEIMKTNRVLILFMCMAMLTACVHFPFSGNDEINTQITQAASDEPIIVETYSMVDDTPSGGLETSSPTDFGKNARLYLEDLSGDIGDRISGSENASKAAKYIEGVFEKIGYSTESQQFTGYDDYEETNFNSLNIIAVKQGLSDQQIIVGAHYDSVDEDGSQGADDNASGVAVMLETAERVFAEETPYTIVFVAFGGEEEGLWGSTNYVDQLDFSKKNNIIGMINLDSLIAGDKTYIYGNEGPGSMRDWMLQDAKKQGFEVEGKTDEELYNEDGTPCECSDFDAFEKSHIPYAYFEATDWDLSPDGMTQVDPQYGSNGEIRHTEYDTIEYIEKTFPGRIDDHLNVFSKLLYDLVTHF